MNKVTMFCVFLCACSDEGAPLITDQLTDAGAVEVGINDAVLDSTQDAFKPDAPADVALADIPAPETTLDTLVPDVTILMPDSLLADSMNPVPDQTAPDSQQVKLDYGMHDTKTDLQKKCTSNAECSDGITCTTDICKTDGTCVNLVVPNKCAIPNSTGGAYCTPAGTEIKAICGVCDPSISSTSWSPMPDGEECDDGKYDTHTDTCNSGVCSGIPYTCPAASLPCKENIPTGYAPTPCWELVSAGFCIYNGACVANGESVGCYVCAGLSYKDVDGGKMMKVPACDGG